MKPELPTEIDERAGGTSASNAPGDALCHGRHQAQKGLKSVITQDNQFGIAIHDALAKDDPANLDGDQLSIYESCEEIRTRLIQEKFGFDAAKVQMIKEERLWWKSESGDIHSGKPDLVVKLGTVGLILEYKTLPGDVEDSPSNLQLRDQVALAAGAYGLTEVDVAIIQPLVTHTPELCRYDTGSIQKSQEELALRVAASNAPDAERVAGTVQCKFCLARFTCKQYSQFTALAAPASMSSLTIPVAMWSPEQRFLFCERLPIAMRWLEECKAQIKDLISKDPNAVPGWRLVEGSVKRPVNNPNELHTRFLLCGGTTDQFLKCVQIVKGELEIQIRAVTKLKGKGLKAKMDELLAGITEDKKDAPSLGVVK